MPSSCTPLLEYCAVSNDVHGHDTDADESCPLLCSNFATICIIHIQRI